MGRQRRHRIDHNSDLNGFPREEHSSVNGYHKNQDNDNSFPANKYNKRYNNSYIKEWYRKPICLIPFALLQGIVIYFLYLGYMETRINTPLASPKVITQSGLEVPDMYWGTYRPGVYFGTKVRHPLSPVTGLMWFKPNHFQNNMLAVRHWCDQADDLPQYGWLKHDGKNFGSQKINDHWFSIQTDFVKRPGGDYGGEWSARIKVKPRSKRPAEEVSLIYYMALDSEDTDGILTPMMATQQSLGSLSGMTESLGDFKLHVLKSKGVILGQYYLSTTHHGLDDLKKTIFKGLRIFQGANPDDKQIGLGGDLPNPDVPNNRPNFVAFQISGKVPFEIEIVYESGSLNNIRPGMLMGKMLTEELLSYSNIFDEKFEARFKLKEKKYDDSAIEFAKAALSNMVGGIGYFYGSSRVQGEYNSEPTSYWKAPLFSGVPSRSFFPRGFLWDEGFHNILISKWDRSISMDIIGHWFDLMNWDGWIPREQILGSEARARVPEEFIIQNSKNANPPTLLLTLHSMVSQFKVGLSAEDHEYLTRLWPRLRTWYNWFNTTQYGELPGTYRWRGRDPKATRELNPKTLTSGLDDYPRASHPTADERHLDLRCWMCLASGLMADIAKLIDKDPTKFSETYEFLSNNENLDSLHWSYTSNGYMDYGLHTDGVALRKLHPNKDPVRIVTIDPRLQYVDSFGYVSFFPLFLQIINPHSQKLGKVLNDLHRPDLLWTNYGLRSLAKNAPIYMKYNTKSDAPYWRGSIWININFLALKSLHYYSNISGPFQDTASQIYKELRENIVNNILKEYQRTGYLWEHYNDQTGKGEGCRPFTGWTALVVLIMSEEY